MGTGLSIGREAKASAEGRVAIVTHLEVHEATHAITASEFFDEVISVLPYALDQIAGEAHIQGSIALVGENPHAPSRAPVERENSIFWRMAASRRSSSGF